MVAIESQRAGCVVVGEDLGTVPDEVREAMDRHRVLRSYVAEFALPGDRGGADRPTRPPHGRHRRHPRHADLRRVRGAATTSTPAASSGLLDAEHAGHELAARQRADRRAGRRRSSADGYLAGPGDEQSLLRALVELLGDSESPAVLVSLDDLLGEIEPAERARHAGRSTQLGAAAARPADRGGGRPARWPPRSTRSSGAGWPATAGPALRSDMEPAHEPEPQGQGRVGRPPRPGARHAASAEPAAPPQPPPFVSGDDLWLFNEGAHTRLYERLGAQLVPGRRGVRRVGPQRRARCR